MLISPIQIVEQSWKLCVTHWRKMTVYALLLFLPTIVLSVSSLLGMYLSARLPTSNLANNIIILLIFAASLVFSLWASLALTIALKNLAEGKPTATLKEALSGSSHLIWPAILASVIVTLIVVLGALLLIVPGIIFAVWYAFVLPAVVLDEQRGMAALRASKALVAGRWWDILWRLLVPGVIFGLALTVIQNLLYLPIDYFISSKITNDIVSSLTSSLIASAITPLTLAATVILYLNAKQTPVAPPDTPIEPPQS